ncbi:MAG TPA: AmmeMemoRadiSam system protein A [Candidatus Cloacimonadota bacterium]|nr:AmmeMemoRadiSam system protein A [Candidatus Cloacimonadota bacterium]HPT71048.1 AmmeMemoRadiSam system protein A [Candidatus Cloacimonadota bacterium]
MNDTQKQYLLTLARSSIASYLESDTTLLPPKPTDTDLLAERAVFVTLTQHGELRGCIGHMQAREPLYKAVVEMSIAAAVEDPRFNRLSRKELDNIQISISILSPLSSIDDWKKIRIGIDGVWVRRGFRSGVFLPQVATETGWGLETFLQHLCRDKAGLSADAYKQPDTELYIFQVEKIEE